MPNRSSSASLAQMRHKASASNSHNPNGHAATRSALPSLRETGLDDHPKKGRLWRSSEPRVDELAPPPYGLLVLIGGTALVLGLTGQLLGILG